MTGWLFLLGAAFVIANHYDFPPAQMTISILVLLLPIAWFARTMNGTAR